MAGAHITQMVSALLKNGPGHLKKVCADLEAWMEENEWSSLNEMRGNMSQERIPNPQIYERANYIMMLQTWERMLRRLTKRTIVQGSRVFKDRDVGRSKSIRSGSIVFQSVCFKKNGLAVITASPLATDGSDLSEPSVVIDLP